MKLRDFIAELFVRSAAMALTRTIKVLDDRDRLYDIHDIIQDDNRRCLLIRVVRDLDE